MILLLDVSFYANCSTSLYLGGTNSKMESNLQRRIAGTWFLPALAAMLLMMGSMATACSSSVPETEVEQAAPVQNAGSDPGNSSLPDSQVSSPTVPPAEQSARSPAAVSTSTPAATGVSAATHPATPPVAAQVPALTATPIVDMDGEDSRVTADRDYEGALSAARLSTRGWDTDFRLHTVPYSEIRSVIPRDNIPSIDEPSFVAPSEASAWLSDVEPVVSLEISGDARAYPLQILTWHEIVNDTVGDVPVAVTFCPLCNSAIAFDRRLDGKELEFGVSGNLRNSDLIMYDRETHSWWQQFTGEGIVGEHAGRSLDHLSAVIVSFADFQRAHPNGKVLSRDTGYARQYGRNPYAGYDTTEGNPFLFTGDLDGRLLPVERVIAVTIGDVDVAFPLSILQEEGVINYEISGSSIVVFHKFGTTSALDGGSIADSRDVGSAGVFDAILDGQELTFSVKNEDIIDDQTGSKWDILGNAVDGPLAGERLTPVVHGNHFWFAWAVFKPETLVYQGREGA